MHILICGGGNAAHTLAGLLASRPEHDINVYLSFPEEADRWRDGLAQHGGMLVRRREGDLLGRPRLVSSSPEEVASQAQLVLLALPAFAHENVLRQLAPHLQPGVWLGALPARGAFDLCARDALRQAAGQTILFGLQTLPWACRIQRFGQSVQVLGTKARVDLAASPPEQAAPIAQSLTTLLGLQVSSIANFLSLTLAGTGQIIHPGIMYGLFHDWDGAPLSEAPLFYQAVDAFTAGVLQAMSDEVQSVCRVLQSRFPHLDLSAVRPLSEWLELSYGSDIRDSSSLQAAFNSNRSYLGLKAPVWQSEDGLAPDFQARYLSEDVPYALAAARGIAELAGVPTPQIDEVMSWAQARLGQELLVDGKLQGKDIYNCRSPQRYGINSLEQLLETMLEEEEPYGEKKQ